MSVLKFITAHFTWIPWALVPVSVIMILVWGAINTNNLIREHTMRVTFEQWKEQVNEAVRKLTREMLDANSLPDIDYMSLYNNKVTPKQAAKQAIRNALE